MTVGLSGRDIAAMRQVRTWEAQGYNAAYLTSKRQVVPCVYNGAQALPITDTFGVYGEVVTMYSIRSGEVRNALYAQVRTANR